jgi:hypothetical protein
MHVGLVRAAIKAAWVLVGGSSGALAWLVLWTPCVKEEGSQIANEI